MRASCGSRARACARATRTTSRSRRRRRITGAEVVALPEPSPEERPVLVVDLGGQYSQLIARRVREARVYSELVPHTVSPAAVRARRPHALVLSGGPASVYADGAPHVDPGIFDLGVPTLGICYGMQLMAQELGGRVDRTGVSEFGKTELRAEEGALFAGLPDEQTVWMSHRDSVVAPPEGARVVAGSPSAPIAAFEDPPRKPYGEEFIRVFEAEARRLGDTRFLVQGTLYSDVIESGGAEDGVAATIKSHHNVGGLPADMRMELVEPLRLLFKDEVRRVGEELGLPERMVWRQPIPGPGLAIRIIGEVTRERLEILRAADAILQAEVRRAGLYRSHW